MVLSWASQKWEWNNIFSPHWNMGAFDFVHVVKMWAWISKLADNSLLAFGHSNQCDRPLLEYFLPWMILHKKELLIKIASMIYEKSISEHTHDHWLHKFTYWALAHYVYNGYDFRIWRWIQFLYVNDLAQHALLQRSS